MFPGTLLCAFVATLVGLGRSQTGPDVKIVPHRRSLLLTDGARQVLTCIVAHHPSKDDTITWVSPYYEGNPPDVRKDLGAVRNSDGTFTSKRELIIESFSEEYTGTYNCAFDYAAGGTKTQASIDLIRVTEQKSDEVYYFGNDTVTLFCKTEYEESKFKEWLKDNETLESGVKYTVNENNSLTITKLDRDDAGRYQARYDLTDGSDHTLDCFVDYKAGPLVLDMDKSINREEEEHVDIKCEVKGWPHAEITWLKDKEVVKEKEDVIIFNAHNGVPGAMLTISSLEFDHEGVYTCRAYSAEFNETNEKSIKLRVKDKLAWLWPFLGIIAEAIVLVLLILFFEKFRKKDGGSSSSNHPHEQ